MQPPAQRGACLEILLLGPVEARVDGHVVPLARQQLRALLALFALNANGVVSTDGAIDALWGDRPPATAPVALYGLVSSLRKQLGEAGAALATRPPGYMLELRAEQLDLARFEELAAAGRHSLADGDAEAASARLTEALSLWRGPPLQDLAFMPFAARETGRLVEFQLTALEDRIEADLARGRDGDLVPELEQLVGEHPLRERLRGQLMLALYRAGRQADALAAYRDARTTLVDELGLDPSDELQELERAILRHDPALASSVKSPSAPLALRRRRSRLLVLAGVVGAATVAAVVLSTREAGGGSVSVVSDGVAVLDGGKVVAAGPVGSTPSDVAATSDGAWITNTDDHTVARVDPETGTVHQTIHVGPGAGGVAADEHGVWVANSLSDTVTRIDPVANAAVDRIPVGKSPTALALDGDALWVVSSGDQTLTQLDARTGRKVGTPIPVGASPRAVATGDGAVWVADTARNAVFRVDPRRRKVVKQINVGNSPVALAFGSGSVWSANNLDGTVSRIDPKRNVVAETVPVGDGPRGLALTDDGVWVSNEFDGTLRLIDPASNRVVRSVRVGEQPEGIAVSGGKLVVAVRPANAAHRGGTLRILVPKLARTFDPIRYAPTAPGLHDGLVGVRQVGGADGAQLVPNLAVRIPQPTDGGTTYTFHLRPGIRYSTGRLVQPADISRALERELRIGDDNGRQYYLAIEGAEQCVAKPTSCDLSRGIVTDEQARTITFHLSRPDPNFLYALAFPLAFAVPADTPVADLGTKPLPSTGPYMVESFDPSKQLTLVRNPYFHEWSRAAHPDAYADRQVVRPVDSSDERVRMVEHGEADWAFDVPLGLGHEVRTQYASQVKRNPISGGVTYLFLNENTPPFNDVRARRAVNYAVDRMAGARASTRGVGGDATCQILPPDFPGYRPYCPYTASPQAGGRWTAPDLPEARRLVAASHTGGARVSVWVPPNHRGEEAFMGSVFRRLGYRVTVHKASARGYYGFLSDPANRRQTRIQAGPFTWFADMPTASNYIEGFYTCGAGNWSGFCDRRVDRLVRHASALQVTDPYLANRLWARIDRTLVDRAVAVPLYTLREFDIVSRRVGNYQYNPQWGPMVEQFWVR